MTALSNSAVIVNVYLVEELQTSFLPRPRNQESRGLPDMSEDVESASTLARASRAIDIASLGTIAYGPTEAVTDIPASENA